MGRSFYLYPRNGIFYTEIFSPSGKRLFSRSTKKTNRDDAAVVAAEWVRNGVPRKSGVISISEAVSVRDVVQTVKAASLLSEDAETIIKNLLERGLVAGSFVKPGPASLLFLDFLRNAWDPEKSAFLREKAAYGHAITKRHIIESSGIISRYWDKPELNSITLIDVTREMLKSHLMRLKEAGYSSGTCNKAFGAVSSPLGWAFREKIIPTNPAAGIPRFTATSKERGILERTEIEALIEYSWDDERARIGFLAAYTCGLRLSEVIALQLQDVEESYINVRHSWSWADGLTTCKNKEARTVPVLPEVRDALRTLGAKNPHKKGDVNFIFYGLKPDQPLDAKIITNGFLNALHGIGITEEARKERNLVFHGLRHLYATALAERLPENIAAKGTGHKDLSTFKHYADHQTKENLEKLSGAAQDAFGTIVQFRKASGGEK